MNVCETVCVICSGASLEEEVDHVRVYDIHVYGCIYMHMRVCTHYLASIFYVMYIHTCQLID